MIDCLIVDDEKDSIDLLIYYAKQVPNLNIVKATTNPMEALALINERKVQLAFCDVQMPLVSGIDLAKAAIGKCKIIFITAYTEYALQGYEHEVFDYLLKPVNFVKFLIAFQKTEKLLATEFAKNVSTDERFKLFELSKREIEIIDFIVRNRTAKEIATDLYIAKSTVDKHIANILKKVNVNSKYELVSKYYNTNSTYL